MKLTFIEKVKAIEEDLKNRLDELDDHEIHVLSKELILFLNEYKKDIKQNIKSDLSPLKIGDTYVGGIIVSLDASGQHGLVVSHEDLSTSANWKGAKKLCAEYNCGGFCDWYLPTIDELKIIYKAIKLSGNYWSSSEYSANSAWYWDMFDGYSYGYDKSYTYNVRAVRAF
jgi:hypothetical protein